jgi:hypothetical protein
MNVIKPVFDETEPDEVLALAEPDVNRSPTRNYRADVNL